MSKGIKRVLVIAVVVVALIAVTTTVAFAWWDSSKSSINIETSNTASNVVLSVAKGTASTTDRLVPNGAFTDATHKTSICIGSFTPTITSTNSANNQAAIAKTKLTYSIKSLTIGGTDKAKNFDVTINTTSANATDGIIVASNGELTSGTQYYIHIAFHGEVAQPDVAGFDTRAISLTITLTATSK